MQKDIIEKSRNTQLGKFRVNKQIMFKSDRPWGKYYLKNSNLFGE